MYSTSRSFVAPKFQDGFKLLLENLPGLREALAIKDVARAPRTPKALLTLIGHLHQNKNLPTPFTLDVLDVTPEQRRVTGPKTTSVRLILKDLTVGFEYDNPKSVEPIMFFFTLKSETKQVVVHAEGLLA